MSLIERPGPLLVVATILLLPVTAAQAADVEAGKAVFDSTCVVCHGPSGSPDPDSPVVQGLGVVPADLSDPLFAREALRQQEQELLTRARATSARARGRRGDRILRAE